MESYDLAVFWEWNYDKPFNNLLSKAFQERNLKIYFVDPANIASVDKLLQDGQISFRWFMDRASETDARFLPVLEKCSGLKIPGINPVSSTSRTLSKAYLHRLLLSRDIPLPETIILPPFSAKPELPFFTFEKLGIPFVLKPANGGGGEGVHLGLTELSQVELYRREFPDSEYLVQQTVMPKKTGGRPVWYRIYFVCDDIYFTFWNPDTKIFSLIMPGEIDDILTASITRIITEIAKTSKLRFFSSEIAVKPDNKPVVIDYVNDPVDLRPECSHKDGLPDKIISNIASSIVRFISAS